MKRILGLCDTVTTCECCGRTNLKSTVVIGDEMGEAYYGSVCASGFLGGAKTAKGGAKVTNAALAAQTKREKMIEHVANLWTLRENGGRGWSEWVFANKHVFNGRNVVEVFNEIINERFAQI